jgi:ABC-type polysaccharide/polyol phosphate transport system ATPase subunit
MSPEGTVRVEHVWKRFRRDRGRRLLRDHIGRVGRRVAGRSGENPWRWVLRDIDFEIQPGESVGFVGSNGAGKSTLLKIISGVMFPHSGEVQVSGRIGALIEVASGIHPELTGKENINVFGTLLGLGRTEVARKYDEIVAFAELEDAINRQVKFYSSGMKTRLGFAIAAFLEPSVLVVDEVLAVGDQLFQQKCLDRMRTVLQSGTTLLLVSHDLAAVGATASRAIWLADGSMRADGPVDEVLAGYRTAIEAEAAAKIALEGDLRIDGVRVTGPFGGALGTDAPATVSFDLTSTRARQVNLFLGVSQGPATPIFAVRHQVHLTEGTVPVTVDFERIPLPAGSYFLWFGAFEPNTKEEVTPWQPIGPMLVEGGRRLDPTPRAIVRLSPVYVPAAWSTGA